MRTADIGMIGLAVMGQNLVLNMADHGFTVAVYNRTTRRTTEFVNGPAAGAAVIGTETMEGIRGAPHEAPPGDGDGQGRTGR